MHADGVLGLAHFFDDVSGPRPDYATTFIRTFFNQHPRMKKQFSLQVQKVNNDEKDMFGPGSTLTFGDISEDGTSSDTDTSEGLSSYFSSSFLYGKRHYMERTSLWLTSIWSLGWSGSNIKGSSSSGSLSGSGSGEIDEQQEATASAINSRPKEYTFFGGGGGLGPVPASPSTSSQDSTTSQQGSENAYRSSAEGAPALIDSGSSFLVVTETIYHFLFDTTTLKNCEPYLCC